MFDRTRNFLLKEIYTTNLVRRSMTLQVIRESFQPEVERFYLLVRI